MIKNIFTHSALLLLSNFCIGQSSINSTGSDAASPQGSVSYSIGSYTNVIEVAEGSSYSGPQIPFELLEPCGPGTTPGCLDSNACNYDPAADCNDGSCDYNDIDQDGICDVNDPYPTPPGSGGALDFDGVDDKVIVADNSILDEESSFSLELWVRFNEFGTGGYDRAIPLLSKWVYAGNPDNSYIFLELNGQLELWCSNGSGSAFIRLPHNLLVEVWHHLAVTFENGTGSLFIDGRQVGTPQVFGGVSNIQNSTQPIRLGDWYTNMNPTFNTFNGQMDEVRIWMGAALSNGEIRDYMCQKDLTSHPQIANLAAYYRFDDDNGSPVLQDISGNGNHGTLSNMDPATDWITSGAPIGDISAQAYSASSVSLSDGTSFTADDLTGSPDGVHVYKVNEAPNDTSIPGTYDSLESSAYYGVHLVGGSSPTYSATLDYSTNTIIDGQPNESIARIASRANNAAGAFQDVAAQTIDPGANTITLPNQSGTEYIVGFLQAVPGCLDENSCEYNPLANLDDGSCLNYPGDSCDDGNASTAGDTIQADCECLGTIILGCTDLVASNYNPAAAQDDGSCSYCIGTINYNTTLPDPIVIGSGISSNHMAVSSDCSIRAGIKAFERFIGDVIPSGTGDTYRFLTGESPTSGIDPSPDPGTARWNYLISINLGSFNFEQVNAYLDIDFDPADGAGQTGPFTANISQTMIDNGLGATSFVQDSQNLGFGFWQTLGSPDILPYNPFVNGVYDLTLRIESLQGDELINIPIRVELYTQGCTDPTACNYNQAASEDDGSCLFPQACEFCSGEDDGTGIVLDGDSDNDGLCDVDEINIYGSDPNIQDTDGDGLTDGFEVNFSGTSPINPDSDGDLCNDNLEYSGQCPDSPPCGDPSCLGDLNSDGFINTGDLTALLGVFGTMCP